MIIARSTGRYLYYMYIDETIRVHVNPTDLHESETLEKKTTREEDQYELKTVVEAEAIAVAGTHKGEFNCFTHFLNFV